LPPGDHALLRLGNPRLLLSTAASTQVPYDFTPVEMLKHWQQCKGQIIAERQKYEEYFDYFQDLSSQLQKNNNFKISRPSFKNNTDIASKVQILQRLKRYAAGNTTEVSILELEDFRILCQEYKLD
jgi:hypothetical protein